MRAIRSRVALVVTLVSLTLWILVGGTPGAAAGGATYVGRIASAKSSTTSTTVTLKTTAAVTGGDGVLVSGMLGGAGTGAVTATDSLGDSYAVNQDRSDTSGNRLLVLSSQNVRPMPSGTSITITFPSSSSSFFTVDDFRGIGAFDTGTSATGGASPFNSGPVSASAGELVFGVVGTVTKGSSAWSSGWTSLAAIASGPRRLAPAYRVAAAAGTYNATGTTGGAWLAAALTYKPEAPPVAQLAVTPDASGTPLAVMADASGSTDTDSTPIASYTFNFGDGTVVGPQSSATASHSYASNGTYTVKVTVTDTAGYSSTAQASLVPPAAKLAVSPSSGQPPLGVTADASGSTDTDSTPIASYTFNFGDGSAAVGPQAAATATHTYSSTGTYNVVVTVTDTAGFSSTATSTVNVTSDAPPVAKLAVTPSSGAPPLAVTADASGSTDTDSTPIASYTFNFGDGSAAVGPQAGATATHTYSSTGTYNVVVTVTDTAGLSSQATFSVTVSSSAQVVTYAGYYDTHHANTNPKPSPWQGSPNAVFVGTPDSSSGGWDTSAVRVDNVSGASLAFVSVTVDIGTHHFALWNSTSLGAGQTLILAQTAYENFDGSDYNPAGCYGCDPTLCTTDVSTTVPVIHVTVNGVTTNYPDTRQILNTHGVDSAGCPYTGTRNDESENWQQVPASSP